MLICRLRRIAVLFEAAWACFACSTLAAQGMTTECTCVQVAFFACDSPVVHVAATPRGVVALGTSAGNVHFLELPADAVTAAAGEYDDDGVPPPLPTPPTFRASAHNCCPFLHIAAPSVDHLCAYLALASVLFVLELPPRPLLWLLLLWQHRALHCPQRPCRLCGLVPTIQFFSSAVQVVVHLSLIHI